MVIGFPQTSSRALVPRRIHEKQILRCLTGSRRPDDGRSSPKRTSENPPERPAGALITAAQTVRRGCAKAGATTWHVADLPQNQNDTRVPYTVDGWVAGGRRVGLSRGPS